MEKFFEISYLMDIYQDLLTQRQIEVMNMYYNENYSLGEIASLLQISRQAVYDLIKRGEALLYDYDNRLGLLKKHLDNEVIINEIENIVSKAKLSNDDQFKFDSLIIMLKNNI